MKFEHTFGRSVLRICRLLFLGFCKKSEREQKEIHPAMRIQPGETILVERRCMPEEIAGQQETKR